MSAYISEVAEGGSSQHIVTLANWYKLGTKDVLTAPPMVEVLKGAFKSNPSLCFNVCSLSPGPWSIWAAISQLLRTPLLACRH